MKLNALSVKQPWAEMISNGSKYIEIRTWQTKYRGPLLICASSRQDASFNKLDPDCFRLGCACCIVDLLEIDPMSSKYAKGAYPMSDMEDLRRGRFKGQYAWYLDNPRVICDFIPVKGKLHIFEVELQDDAVIMPADKYYVDE